MERYKKIKNSFIKDVSFQKGDILIDERKLNKVSNEIPNFIINDLDALTNKMSEFYNDIQFPNYDDFEDYASLYDCSNYQVYLMVERIEIKNRIGTTKNCRIKQWCNGNSDKCDTTAIWRSPKQGCYSFTSDKGASWNKVCLNE